MTASFYEVAIPVVTAILGTAAGAVAGAVFQPLGVLAWEAFRRRRFDPKRAHYNELIEDSKWFVSRAVKLHTFRQQYQLSPPADRFRLSEMTSKLDATDAEWVRRTDASLLVEATAHRENVCRDEASHCVRRAEEVSRKIFW